MKRFLTSNFGPPRVFSKMAGCDSWVISLADDLEIDPAIHHPALSRLVARAARSCRRRAEADGCEQSGLDDSGPTASPHFDRHQLNLGG